MKQTAFWGLIGFVIGGSVIVAPEASLAQTKLADLSKAASSAASKLAGKITGKAVSASTVISSTAVIAAPSVAADKSARVMLLDKQTNRRQVMVMVVGSVQTVGTLQVKLSKCLPDYGAVLGQDVAWLEITEGADGNGRTTPWFAGWMFNTYPEISTLDHPRYDVQLQGCGTTARQVIKATGSAPVLDSTGPAVDTETSNDAPVSDGTSGGNDPYYVPGVGKATSATVKVAPVETHATEVDPAEVGKPLVDTETPAAVTPPEKPVGDQPSPDDLHKMMDSGQY